MYLQPATWAILLTEAFPSWIIILRIPETFFTFEKITLKSWEKGDADILLSRPVPTQDKII
jgi:hypothetical protein